jgi:hypothetical protein
MNRLNEARPDGKSRALQNFDCFKRIPGQSRRKSVSRVGNARPQDCFESSGALANKNIFARFSRTLSR